MEVQLKTCSVDLDFHPSTNLVAACLLSGRIGLYRYTAEAPPQEVLNVQTHYHPCSSICFVRKGRAILSGSLNGDIHSTDVESGITMTHPGLGHESAVSEMVNLTESTVASGDTKGRIKVWDSRMRYCCSSSKVHRRCISDMKFAPDSMKFVATSWDGSLSVHDLRSNQVQTQSNPSEDPLLSVVIMKSGRNVTCGTLSGALLMYWWGFFQDCSDRFDAQCPKQVNGLVKVDEDRVISGSNKGLMRLVGIVPNRMIQPIVENSSDMDCFAASYDKKFLACILDFNKLKIWDLDELLRQSSTMQHDDAS